MKALAIIPAIWAAVALLWFFTIGAEIADSQPVLPEDSPVATACAHAGALAESQKVGMLKCRLVGISYQPESRPNHQIVTVRVKIAGQGWFQVAVFLHRSVWNVQTATITPEVR